MRRTALLTGLILWSSVLLADDHHIDFDPHTDFSRLKTFAIRDSRIESQKPELNNRLFIQTLSEAIRAELKKKGLKETTEHPDLFVDFSIAGMDYSTSERQGATRIPDVPGGRRGYIVDGIGPYPVLSSEGTLVIDLKANTPGTAVVLLWRGMYRDEESSIPKLAEKLPRDARKLLSEYPPKIKK